MGVTDSGNGIRSFVRNNDTIATAQTWFNTALNEAGDGKWAMLGAKISGVFVFLTLATLLVGFTGTARTFLLIGVFVGVGTIYAHALYGAFLFFTHAQETLNVDLNVNIDLNVEQVKSTEKND